MMMIGWNPVATTQWSSTSPPFTNLALYCVTLWDIGDVVDDDDGDEENNNENNFDVNNAEEDDDENDDDDDIGL